MTDTQCHQVPHKNCQQVAKERCSSVPQEICTNVSIISLNFFILSSPQNLISWVWSYQFSLLQVPEVRCRKIPSEKCIEVPVEKCSQVPVEKCTQVCLIFNYRCVGSRYFTFLQVVAPKCWDEPREHCTQKTVGQLYTLIFCILILYFDW